MDPLPKNTSFVFKPFCFNSAFYKFFFLTKAFYKKLFAGKSLKLDNEITTKFDKGGVTFYELTSASMVKITFSKGAYKSLGFAPIKKSETIKGVMIFPMLPEHLGPHQTCT